MSLHHFKMPCNSTKHYNTFKKCSQYLNITKSCFLRMGSGYALMTFWVFNCLLTNLGHLKHLVLLHTTVYSLLPNENLFLSSRLVLYDMLFGEKGGVWILMTQHVVLGVEPWSGEEHNSPRTWKACLYVHTKIVLTQIFCLCCGGCRSSEGGAGCLQDPRCCPTTPLECGCL